VAADATGALIYGALLALYLLLDRHLLYMHSTNIRRVAREAGFIVLF
jgi:hypothetical protein